MISALLKPMQPFLLHIATGALILLGLYTGWLKYCLMDAESDLKTEKAQTIILKRDLKDYAIAYDTLAKKTAEQNAQINAMGEETTKAIQRAEKAKNNALGKLKTRDKQLSSIKAESTTCEQSIQRAKDELKGSLL